MIDLVELHANQCRILKRAAVEFGHDEVTGIEYVESITAHHPKHGFYAVLDAHEVFLACAFSEALVALSEPDFRIQPSKLPLDERAELLLRRLRAKQALERHTG